MVDSMGSSKAVVLAVGEEFHLKTGKGCIIYAGMLDENVYSIAQRKSNGYQGFAWSLFFPREKNGYKDRRRKNLR
jgi:hypothetical protein